MNEQRPGSGLAGNVAGLSRYSQDMKSIEMQSSALHKCVKLTRCVRQHDAMDFYNFITVREACKRSGAIDDPDEFYRVAYADAAMMRSGQFYGQLRNEQDWERARRPYYNVWPSIVPMLTRLNLDLDSGLIRLPMPALCVRLPKERNPLVFDWKGEDVQIRCILMGEINDGRGLSILIDVGEMMGDGKSFVSVHQNHC